MTKKKRNILIIVAVIVVLAVLLIVFLGGGRSDENIPEPIISPETETPVDERFSLEIPQEVVEIPANEEETQVYSFDQKAEDEREMTAEDLKQLAFSVAERYGSFSNQGNFGNISDLELYMTEEMKSWSKRYVETESAKPYSGKYYGMTTSALVGEVQSFKDDKAQILVLPGKRDKDSQENVFRSKNKY